MQTSIMIPRLPYKLLRKVNAGELKVGDSFMICDINGDIISRSIQLLRVIKIKAVGNRTYIDLIEVPYSFTWTSWLYTSSLVALYSIDWESLVSPIRESIPDLPKDTCNTLRSNV